VIGDKVMSRNKEWWYDILGVCSPQTLSAWLSLLDSTLYVVTLSLLFSCILALD